MIDNTAILALDASLRLVAPIEGVSVVSWDDRSTWVIDFDLGATKEQQQAALAILDTFDPTAVPPGPKFVPTFVALGRLTAQEYTGIMQASAALLAAGDGSLARWLDMARTDTQGINLNSPDTAAAKAHLVSSGLLTQQRADVVLSP